VVLHIAVLLLFVALLPLLTVAGLATHAAEGKEYRDRGATLIEPAKDAGVIFACASNLPLAVLPKKALVRHFSVVPLMLLGCVPLYTLLSDYSETECFEACKGSGWCTITSNLEITGWREALDRLRHGNHVQCAATSDAACRPSLGCQELGRCTASAGRCIASSADDCRQTTYCLTLGWCSPLDGGCGARTVEDCASADT